ncbi:hypothetical protein [Streptomyces lincolnensis]|uniref:hypothetical protein n=1 Tax=Streptomyces lincolnensis TaxID=1915 RepID=UPI0037D49579
MPRTPTDGDVTEVTFTESEVAPVVAGAPPYSQVVVFDESEAEVIEGRPPGYTNVVFSESEVDSVVVDRDPAYEIIFAEPEVEPIIGRRPAYDVGLYETEAEPGTDRSPLHNTSIYGEPPTGIGAPARPGPYADVLAPRQRRPRTKAAVPSPVQRIDFTEPVVITGVPPRTGPMPVQRTTGLTDLHRRLLGKRVVPADPMERWGIREAGRALVERRLSRTGTSTSLANYKDRWVRAHRHVIRAAAQQYDIPAWVLAGVAWTEVGGDPEVQDEVAALGLRPERVSFGPVQMELRRGAEELGYEPQNMSALQRRVLIWSLLDPQQNLFLVASHLDRLRDRDIPDRTAAEMTREDIRVLGARYNRGPELTREQILTTGPRTKYGDDVLRKQERVERLLAEESE